MPRQQRLKVFRAHFGFYDTIVAAPSQKAALAAWGVHPSEFAQGFARLTTDPAAVTAARADPGTVLKRPIGSNGDYSRDPALPKAPRLTAKQKAAAKAREKKSAAAAKKAERAAQAKAKATHDARLKEIEAEEAALREKRAAVERAFKTRTRSRA